MSPLRFARLFILLSLTFSLPLLGCGDDSDDTGDGGSMDAGDGDGDNDPDTARPRFENDAGGNTGMDMPEGGEEGAPCESAIECGEGLACVTNIFTIGVCARPCTSNGDCDAAEFERCVSYTQFEADAHCVNEVEDTYEICGVADTSICAGNRECLYFPDLPLGVCVDLCPLAGDGDGGTDDSDGGALPDGIVECGSSDECLDILADAAGVGVCGTVVERGAECGLDVGLYCEEGDFCRRTDPEDLDEAPLCRQNCSDSLECDEGECTRLDLDTRVCIE